MNDQEFITAIEDIVIEYDTTQDKPAAVTKLVKLFIGELKEQVYSEPKPGTNSKAVDHLQHLMYLVKKMRGLQETYFSGNKKVFNDALSAEKHVDVLIRKYLNEEGYTLEAHENKVMQQTMF